MLQYRTAVSTCVLSLMLGACAPSGIDMSTPASATPPIRSYRTNPAPTDGYRITMTIRDAPGPFASMRALAQYDVQNEECLSPPKDNPGGHSAPVPTEDVDIPLRKIGEDTYEGVLYADQMLDENYTGRGVCRWKLMSFRVRMKGTGAAEDTLFVPSILSKELVAQASQAVYFMKENYPRVDAIPEFPDMGEYHRDWFKASIRDDDLFTVTFDSRKNAL